MQFRVCKTIKLHLRKSVYNGLQSRPFVRAIGVFAHLIHLSLTSETQSLEWIRKNAIVDGEIWGFEFLETIQLIWLKN